MPILHIRALPQKKSDRIQTALKTVCSAIAAEYKCDSRHVWATWEEIRPNSYVEGETEAELQPQDTHPPICELLCFEGKSPEQIEKLLILTAKTLSESLGIPENIFVHYREVKSGEVVAGNGIVRKK